VKIDAKELRARIDAERLRAQQAVEEFEPDPDLGTGDVEREWWEGYAQGLWWAEHEARLMEGDVEYEQGRKEEREVLQHLERSRARRPDFHEGSEERSQLGPAEDDSEGGAQDS